MAQVDEKQVIQEIAAIGKSPNVGFGAMKDPLLSNALETELNEFIKSKKFSTLMKPLTQFAAKDVQVKNELKMINLLFKEQQNIAEQFKSKVAMIAGNGATRETLDIIYENMVKDPATKFKATQSYIVNHVFDEASQEHTLFGIVLTETDGDVSKDLLAQHNTDIGCIDEIYSNKKKEPIRLVLTCGQDDHPIPKQFFDQSDFIQFQISITNKPVSVTIAASAFDGKPVPTSIVRCVFNCPPIPWVVKSAFNNPFVRFLLDGYDVDDTKYQTRVRPFDMFKHLIMDKINDDQIKVILAFNHKKNFAPQRRIDFSFLSKIPKTRSQASHRTDSFPVIIVRSCTGGMFTNAKESVLSVLLRKMLFFYKPLDALFTKLGMSPLNNPELFSDPLALRNATTTMSTNAEFLKFVVPYFLIYFTIAAVLSLK